MEKLHSISQKKMKKFFPQINELINGLKEKNTELSNFDFATFQNFKKRNKFLRLAWELNCSLYYIQDKVFRSFEVLFGKKKLYEIELEMSGFFRKVYLLKKSLMYVEKKNPPVKPKKNKPKQPMGKLYLIK